MEAQGHEKLIDRTIELLSEKLKEAGFNESDFDLNSYYLGNWIADFSQFNDESIKFKVYQTINYPKEFIDLLKTIIDAAIESFENLYAIIENYLENDQKALKILTKHKGKLTSAFRTLVELAQSIKDEIHSLKDFIGDEVEKPFFDEVLLYEGEKKEITDIENNESLKSIEKALTLFTKFIGYNKFVLNARVSLGTNMDSSLYIEIFDEIFRKYLPYEHLDRAVSVDKINKVKVTAKDLLSKLIESGAALDDRVDSNSGSSKELRFYTYLDEYLSVACGKLSGHEEFFKNEKDKSKLNLELAKLGNTLHTFEDYFAHSNFIDFSNVFLIRAFKSAKVDGSVKKLIRELFYGKNAYSGHEQYKSIRATKNVATQKEDAFISTGYYDFTDTIASLYHLLMGSVGRIADTDAFKSITDSENLEAYGGAITRIWTDKIDVLEENLPLDMLLDKKTVLARKLGNSKKSKEREKLEKDIRSVQETILARKQFQELFSHKEKATIPEVITVEETTALFTYDQKTIDPYSQKLLTGIINLLVYAKYSSILRKEVKKDFEIANTLIDFTAFLFTTIRIIVLIYYYPANAYRILLVAFKAILPDVFHEMLKVTAKEFAKDILERALTKGLEYTIGKRINQWRLGSHSLIAKDDDFKQEKLNTFALDMAENVDKFIIKNLFFDSKKEAKRKIESAINNNLLKINILRNEYDLSGFSPIQDHTPEELYRLLVEKDKQDNPGDGLHNLYCDWNHYLKGMISFKYGIPSVDKKLSSYIIRNLKNDRTFNNPEYADKYGYYLSWDKNHEKIPKTISIYSDLELTKNNVRQAGKPMAINVRGFNEMIKSLNKALEHPPEDGESIDLNEIIMEDTHFDRWFFSVMLENQKGYRDNDLLNFFLPKTITPEKYQLIAKQSKCLQDELLKRHREVAIKTTYLKS